MFLPVYNPNHLYLELTNKCNAVCAHCGNCSGPDSDVSLEKSTITNIMNSAKKSGISIYSLSGGEVFLDFEKVLHTIKEAKINKLKPNQINTNAFFANSVDECGGFLEKLKDEGYKEPYRIYRDELKKLRFFPPTKEKYHENAYGGGFALSLDSFHEKFVDPKNVSNFIKAHYNVFGNTENLEVVVAYDLDYKLSLKPLIKFLNNLHGSGLDVVECYQNEKELNTITRIMDEHKLRLKSGDISFRFFPPIPAGRARNFDFETKILTKDDFAQEICSCSLFCQEPATILVKPDGKSYAALDFLCESEGMYLGNVYETSLKTLIKKGQNNFIIDIISFDGANTLQYFMEKNNISVDIESTSPCHFCNQVLSDGELIEELKRAYSGLGWFKEEMRRYNLLKAKFRLSNMGICL
ncbi:MAG: 4Fe-4S cluster-binding domain-containing protein [Candidatus Aenigmarchaeota archaeon]|nr:4Fe-4S cluster-binding domain-containing protein [Candidatus Aenigmarchaeota archaeon]